jgi:delta 1-pyrroline-5-carboxylate dehydrogenase
MMDTHKRNAVIEAISILQKAGIDSKIVRMYPGNGIVLALGGTTVHDVIDDSSQKETVENKEIATVRV